MNIDHPLQLLGGLSPSAFMQRYWQRKPLLIRQAIPGFKPPLGIADIRQIVRREEVESRLIQKAGESWKMDWGPFARLPAMRKPEWTVLAQSMDIHHDGIAQLLHQFRFISDARLDDAMISIASDGGGVGPHFDSYDVFLLQAEGKRRWRISEQKDLSLAEGLPLKILKHFQPEDEFVLEPGDMLYLPPHVAHDGVAEGPCMTISIGFRAPTVAALARGLLEAAGDQVMARAGGDTGLYGDNPLPGPKLDTTFKDRGVDATLSPARVPDSIIDASLKAVQAIRFDERLAARFLGLWLTEPSPAANFQPSSNDIDLLDDMPTSGSLKLDRATRLMYRGKELYINGELAPLPASPLLCKLADARHLDCSAASLRRLKQAERELLQDWLDEGWMHYEASST